MDVDPDPHILPKIILVSYIVNHNGGCLLQKLNFTRCGLLLFRYCDSCGVAAGAAGPTQLWTLAAASQAGPPAGGRGSLHHGSVEAPPVKL